MPRRPMTDPVRASDALDEVEAGLLEAVETVLEVTGIGLDSQFFDIGGHSLAALELVAEIATRFSVRVPVRTVFESPTLRDLAVAIARRPRDGEQAAAARPDAAHAGRRRDIVLPLSPQQRRFYETSFDGDGPWNTMHTSFELEHELSEPVFRRSIDLIAARHPALRLALVESAGGLQNVFRFETPLPADMGERRQDLMAESWPLWRFACHAGEGDRQRVDIWCHHMVGDGIALQIVAQDLAEVLGALSEDREPELAPGMTYVDSVRERTERYPHLIAERAYWRHVFDAPFATYELAERAGAAREQAMAVEEPLAADALSAVHTTAARHGVSPFVILANALFQSIAAVTGDHDITIGLVSSARTLNERRVVGNLMNLVPIRWRNIAGEARQQSVGITAETIRSALGHQEYQFTDIARDLRLDFPESKFPITNVFVNQLAHSASVPSESRTSVPRYTVNFDLEVMFHHFRDGLTAEWEFRTSLQPIVAELRKSFSEWVYGQ